MPVHDLGFRSWEGETRHERERVVVIAETGVRLAWRSMWLRRMLLVAWLPAIYVGVGFFWFENVAKQQSGPIQIALPPGLNMVPGLRQVAADVQNSGLEAARHTVWALMLLFFFRYSQGTLMIMLVGLLAPPLIAQDMRSRAYLIYFSRPLAAWEYALGKMAIVCCYLAMITVVPAIALYILGVFLSPDLSVLRYTWDLPLRIGLASLVLMIPTTTLALCYSSLTRESRYAGFAWFATWALGFAAYQILTWVDLNQATAAPTRWTLLSLYHTLGSVQSWIMGLEPNTDIARNAGLLLGIITVVAWGILLRRIEAPLRE